MTKECNQCKEIFEKPYNESISNWLGRHKYCSIACYNLSKKGKPAWNKGKIGVQPSTRKGLKILEMRGANHPNWRGGTNRKERHTEMGRVEYKKWREAVFIRDNYTCQICDHRGGYIHADHIKSWASHTELRYEVCNGRTLCRMCHYFVTFKSKMSNQSKWGLTAVVAQA
jgi:hypothetical protein